MSVYDLIEKVAARYPDADVGDAAVLADEVEEEILATVDTVPEVLDLLRPLLTQAVMTPLRGRVRRKERASDRRRRRRNRPQLRVGGSDAYTPHTTEELRSLLMTPEIEALLEEKFVPGRGKPVSYLKATVAHHRKRVEAQRNIGDACYQDAYRHEVFIEAIEDTEGAKNYEDVLKEWRRG
jgi:hypothetical protein